MNFDQYCGLLALHDVFEKTNHTSLSFRYEFDKEKAETLDDLYHINEVAGTGSDLEKALRLLAWVHDTIKHDGETLPDIPITSIDLLAYAYQKQHECGINCRLMSTVLSECLLAIGLCARNVYLMPYSPYDCDNHVATNVYINDLNKWILIDPTFNLYFTDEHDAILDAAELRSKCANMENIKICKDCNYNHKPISEDFLKEYYAKNLFFFKTNEVNQFGTEEEGSCKTVVMCPAYFDVKKWEQKNIDYRIKKYGTSEWLEKRKERAAAAPLIIASIELFEQKPDFCTVL